ncbi:MAG TPA: hypothetical protein VM370_11140 [Candidatus Thermoplasmatota archaeon]|nr:hypothetical protein [Candidatus Thermoplasmatota archaeon]
MRAEKEDLDRAQAILQSARRAAGLAAYEYFFIRASPGARAIYEVALAAESEAEALLEAMAATLDAAGPHPAEP